MIINTQTGIEYQQSYFILNIFKDLLVKPFLQHPVTPAWQTEVLDSYKNKNFKVIGGITGRGQADFDKPFRGLTPEERVLVYCYDGHMQQHTVSQLYIFEKHANIFDKYLFTPDHKVLFIDFGCGPLSSGIALAMYYAKSHKSNSQKLNFNYIGLDKAESMLNKAKDFSRNSDLFHKDATFEFLNPYAYYGNDLYNFKKIFYYYIDNYISQNVENQTNYTIFLNFSYFFASDKLNASLLIVFIKEILSIYCSYNICLVFQNPQGTGFNHKWELFKSGVPDLLTAINGSTNDIFFFHNLRKNQLRDTKLYYDIRIKER